MAQGLSRRDVLKGTAAAAVGLAVGKVGAVPVFSDQAQIKPTVGPNGTIRFGIIGCGGKGWSGMQGAAEFGEIVALADTDANNRSKAMLEHPRACAYDSYKEMLT